MTLGGRRAGAGRKPKPRQPQSESGRTKFIIDFSERIAREAQGANGLLKRVVLALAARQASVAEIAAALGLPADQVVLTFGQQLQKAKAVARLNALNLIHEKAEQGNVTAILWLVRATGRALRAEEAK
jgi:hypothetical protein